MERGESPSGLRRCDQNRRFPAQTPQGAHLGLGTQPRYKTSCDLLVETVKNAVINIRLVRLTP